ncbi:glycosyltransferase family 39 protein, partial [bacterium]|nr:glycosyltransferase family 39 protein [bacterium]
MTKNLQRRKLPGMLSSLETIKSWFPVSDKPKTGTKYCVYILLIAAFCMLSGRIFFPNYPIAFLEFSGCKSGARVLRYNNENWRGKPVSDSIIANLRLERPEDDLFLLKDSHFSLEISGYFYAPANGTYNFELESDDGAFVNIDNRHVISDSGYHSARQKTAFMNLTKGWHDLNIRYFNGESSASFKLMWQAPGRSMSIMGQDAVFSEMPDSRTHSLFIILLILHHWMSIFITIGLLVILIFLTYSKFTLFSKTKILSQIRVLIPGFVLGIFLYLLFWSLYHQPSHNLISHGFNSRFVSSLPTIPVDTGILNTNARLNSMTHSKFRFDHKQIEFTGWLSIDKPGEYEFSLQADDKATLYINQKPLIIFSVSENPRIPIREKLYLHSGLHQIFIEYQNFALPAFLDLQWSTPDSKRFTPIPRSKIFSNKPSANEKIDDSHFMLLLKFTRLTLTGLVLLIFIWVFSKKNKSMSRHTLQTGFSLFCVFFLARSHVLSPDHQAGLYWFTSMNLGSKSLVCLVFFLFISGLFKKPVRCFRFWIKKRQIGMLIMGLLAVFSASVAQICLTGLEESLPVAGIGLYAFAAVAILIAGIRPVSHRERSNNPSTIPGETIVFYICFTGVILAAIFLRFYRLHEMPPGLWWDESQTGRVVQNILERNWPPVYDLRINAGSVASYFNAVWCFIVDTTDPWGLRSYTAFIGVLTVVVSWWFYRQLFNRWWSLFGMALTAGSRWLFTINRTAMATIDETILLTFLVLTLYLRAIRSGKLRYYLSTGLLLGLAMHLHTGARVLPLIIGIDILVRFRKTPSQILTYYGRNVAVLIVSAIIVFAPMGLYILKNTDEYMKRSGETLLATEYPGWYPVGPYLRNVKFYLQTYVYSGDWHPRHNYDRTPQLASLVAICAALGAFLTIGRSSRREHRLMILGFCLISLQGILTVHHDSANLNRIAENIPIVMVWAIYGAEFILRGIKQIARNNLGRVLSFCLAVIAVCVSWQQEFDTYFHRYLP